MHTALRTPSAAKNSTSRGKTLTRLHATTQTPHGPRQSLKLPIQREGTRPLVATCGGLALPRKATVMQDQVRRP
jgi:hypothetical protein